MKLVQFNRSEKYQLLANFEINDDPSLQRGIRISARFWPAHSGRGRARHLLSRIMGKFGYFRAADVVVYMELPQLSHNSVKLIKKDSREFTFSFNYNFPPALKSHISEQIEILRNLLANDDDVNEIVALPLNIEDVLKMDSNHHFAGTRMADNQAGGIVDSKGRTFFSHNLFVVGTSTLPVSSNLHPTFLCAALSLRTASEILRT
jgi:choline dehydrogenase-like flavoprotein